MLVVMDRVRPLPTELQMALKLVGDTG